MKLTRHYLHFRKYTPHTRDNIQQPILRHSVLSGNSYTSLNSNWNTITKYPGHNSYKPHPLTDETTPLSQENGLPLLVDGEPGVFVAPPIPLQHLLPGNTHSNKCRQLHIWFAKGTSKTVSKQSNQFMNMEQRQNRTKSINNYVR